MTRKTVNAGITMPISFVNQIDMARGDICRSRFVLRAVEKFMNDRKERSQTKMNQTEVVGGPSKTTHNLQDVASASKIDTSIPIVSRIYAVSNEHHGT